MVYGCLFEENGKENGKLSTKKEHAFDKLQKIVRNKDFSLIVMGLSFDQSSRAFKFQILD